MNYVSGNFRRNFCRFRLAVCNGNVAVSICCIVVDFDLEVAKISSTIMKPIKPYVDYYITQDNFDNCRRPGSSYTSTCRYVRVTGDTCENLTEVNTFTDSNFSNYLPNTTDNLGSNPYVLMTNCSNIQTNNYNPGIENIILNNTALFLAFGIILMIGVMAWSVIKCLPRLSSRR